MTAPESSDPPPPGSRSGSRTGSRSGASGGRRALVWTLAVLACLAGALAALAVCVVGLGRYLEDYCFTRLPAREEGVVVHGPSFHWPATVRCGYDDAPDVVVTDWQPLLWVVGISLATVAGIAVVLLLARRLTRRVPEGPA